ncbi:MAG: hypothetical protein C4K47_03190 [Candidatus Thorarchaeota archaeon]|nr:MAG: hypothetical protein C4K47_03190 [Candidatus Thorarchaeota archaeon]
MQWFGIFDVNLGQIMTFFASEWVVGWVLIISGLIAAAWLLERALDAIPVIGDLLRLLVHIGTHLGFLIGFLDMLVGYVAWTTQPNAPIVAGILIVTGFALVMRILAKFPLAFLFAAGIAGFATFTLYGLLSPYKADPFIGGVISQVVSLKGMIIVFFIVFAVVYLLGGLLIKLIELIGKVFAAAPVSVLIGLACIGIGIIVIWQPALLSLTIPWPAP